MPIKTNYEHSPQDAGLCPCKNTVIIYTGHKNEVAVLGPATILAIIDEDWQFLLSDDQSGKRHQVTIWTVPKAAATILDANEPV